VTTHSKRWRLGPPDLSGGFYRSFLRFHVCACVPRQESAAVVETKLGACSSALILLPCLSNCVASRGAKTVPFWIFSTPPHGLVLFEAPVSRTGGDTCAAVVHDLECKDHLVPTAPRPSGTARPISFAPATTPVNSVIHQERL